MNKLRQWMENHQKLLELLVDVFAAWLFSAGVLRVICAHFPETSALVEITSFKVLWMTFLGVLVSAVFTRKWWLLPGTALIGAAGAWAFSKTELWEPFLEKLFVYIDWCITGCMLPEEKIAAIPEQIVHDPVWVWLAMAVVCAAVSFLLMRRLFSYLLLFLLSAGSIGVMAYGVYQERFGRDVLWFVSAVLLMCLIAALPRIYARYLKKHDLTRSSDQASGGQMTISRISLQLFAVPAALICVCSAFLIVPQDTSGWKSIGLIHFVTDISDLLRFSFGESEGYWEFSLSTTNMYPLGDRLGGPVELSDRKILSVKTETPILLRGSVQDTYTGSNWVDSRDNGHFRLESPMWSGRKKEILHPAATGSGQMRELQSRMTMEVTLDINPEFYWYSTMFVPDHTQNIRFTGVNRQDVYFNNQGEVFTETMVRGDYEVTGSAFYARNTSIEEQMLLLESLALETRDRDYKEIAAQYLQLPDLLPSSVRKLTASLLEEEMTPYQKACTIADWLEENCSYSLTPEEPPEDADFVEWFLKTREGYCTYYASAMTVMARCAGIPARYVSGFGLRDSGLKDWYYVSEATGHAWAELYFHGIGWVPFDALGWSTENENLQREPVHSVVDWDSFEEDEPEEEEFPELEEKPVKIRRKLPKYFWIVPAVGAFAGLLWLLIAVITYPKRRWSEKNIRGRGIGSAQWTEEYYGDILRQLALMDVHVQPGETLFDFARRVDRRVPVDKDNHPMEQVAQWICAWRFGEKVPPEESLRKLCDYHTRLEQRLRILLGAWEYFWKRCVGSFFIRK